MVIKYIYLFSFENLGDLSSLILLPLYIDHYSGLRTVEANWNLGDLGRKDVGAKVFANLGL